MAQAKAPEVYARHRHGETVDHAFVVERFEDKPTDRRVVDTGILVVLEIRKMLLSDVHHFEDVARLRTRDRLPGSVLRAHVLN